MKKDKSVTCFLLLVHEPHFKDRFDSDAELLIVQADDKHISGILLIYELLTMLARLHKAHWYADGFIAAAVDMTTVLKSIVDVNLAKLRAVSSSSKYSCVVLPDPPTCTASNSVIGALWTCFVSFIQVDAGYTLFYLNTEPAYIRKGLNKRGVHVSSSSV